MKRVRASEIVLAERTRGAIERALAPIEAWREIQAPEAYLEARTGKYISGLEELLNAAWAEGDKEMCRQLLLDLLRMTKIGKAKAEVTLAGVNKLRPEQDLSSVNMESLLEALGRKE